MGIRIGAHVSDTDPLGEARSIGAQAVQIGLGSMTSWKGQSVNYLGGAAQLAADATAADIDIYVHAPFLINVASTNNRVRIPSRKLLQTILNLAGSIGAKGVVVHGGHVAAGDDPEVGFDNWRKCVERLELPVPMFIENTAGGANAMARFLPRIRGLWQAISTTDNINSVGFCLDTCHAHAAGLDLSSIVDVIISITGRIDLLHCNDSRDEPGSGADRHASLGTGTIDPATIAAIVSDANAPVICETPGELDDRRADIAWLRERLV